MAGVSSACPTSHEQLFDASLLTDEYHYHDAMTAVQRIQQEGATDLLAYPNDVPDVMDANRRKFEAVFNYNERTKGELPEMAASLEINTSLRRMLSRAMGFRALHPFLSVAQEIMQSGARAKSEEYRRWQVAEYSGHRDRRSTGERALLIHAMHGHIGRAATKAFGTFSHPQEKEMARQAFYDVTLSMRQAATRVLDAKYGSQWRQIQGDPYTAGISRSQARLMSKLQISDDAEVSFRGAVRSGPEIMPVMLGDLQLALAAAGCDRELWYQIAYANLPRLNLPAYLSYWPADAIAQFDGSESRIFRVAKVGDEWKVTFKDASFERNFTNGKTAHCQGAFSLPPVTPLAQNQLNQMHNKLAARAPDMELQYDIRQGMDTTLASTVIAIAVAERGDYDLSSPM